MGRKKKPSALKRALGTERPGRRNKNEPSPKVVIPKAPEHLSIEAREEWDRIVKEIHSLGMMSSLDRAALSAYCQAYGRWVQAESILNELSLSGGIDKGLTVMTDSGNVIQNPVVGIANKAMQDMVKYSVEFGMTPASRAKVKVDKGDEEKDPAAEYFDS